MRYAIGLGVAMLAVAGTRAAPITDPSFFDGLGATTIDFETFPGSTKTLPHITSLTDEYSGVIFSAEGTPGSETFDGAMWIVQQKGGGGTPTSGVRYATTLLPGEYAYDTPDVRFDFSPTTEAFAVYVIDNDFTELRVTAFGTDDNELEQLIIPQSAEGGVSYHGIASPGISYVIIEAADGGALDSTYFDDFTFLEGSGPLCLSDIDGSGSVDVTDLLLILAQWGPCAPKRIADINGDGFVDVLDLLLLLGNVGPCN